MNQDHYGLLGVIIFAIIAWKRGWKEEPWKVFGPVLLFFILTVFNVFSSSFGWLLINIPRLICYIALLYMVARKPKGVV